MKLVLFERRRMIIAQLSTVKHVFQTLKRGITKRMESMTSKTEKRKSKGY